MRRALKACVVLAAVTIIWAPAQARADGYVSPWVAANSGAGFESGNVFDNGRAGFGVTAGAMGGGIFGGEVDFGYSPSFFGTSSDFGTNSVIDVMGNLIVGIPVGGRMAAAFVRTSPPVSVSFARRLTVGFCSRSARRTTTSAGTRASA